MANMFAIFEPKGCRRHLEVTERRTGVDFAHQMRSLADEHYPEAEKIRVVLDNLNTHTGASLDTGRSSHRRPVGCYVGWSSTTPLSTHPGSTKWR
jgi:hypothetical protein